MQYVITVITHKCHNLTPTISKKRRLTLHGRWRHGEMNRFGAEGEILAELPFFGASEDGIRVPGGAAVKVLVHGINIIVYNIFYIIYIYIYIYYIIYIYR